MYMDLEGVGFHWLDALAFIRRLKDRRISRSQSILKLVPPSLSSRGLDMSSRNFIFLLLLGVLAGGAWGSSVFGYQQHYNMSGKYQDLLLSFQEPRGMWLSDGRIYVTDVGANAVWVLNSSDAVVSRIPSGGSGVVDRPTNLVRSGGMLYIADAGKGTIIAYVDSSSNFNLGPVLASRRTPTGVWVENSTLWLIDSAQNQVLEYDIKTGRGTRTLFGTGGGSDRLSGPADLWADESHFYIADQQNSRVQIYTRNWEYLDSIGTGRGGVTLSQPSSVTSDDGHIYVADTGNSRVVVFSSDGYPLETLADANGTALVSPRSVRISNQVLYVLDSGADKIYTYSMNWSKSTPSVLAEIDALKRSVAQHQANVLDVMDSINLTHAPLKAPFLIAQAGELVNSGQYAEASSRLAQARTELAAVQVQQAQALRIELQKRIDRLLGKLDPYRDATIPAEQAYQRTVIYNRFASAQELLAASDYAGTATLIESITIDVDALRARLDAWRNGQNQTAPTGNTLKNQLDTKTATLRARLAVLNLEAQGLGDNTTSDNLRALIDSGAALAGVGAYEDSTLVLNDAEKRLNDWQTVLDNLQAQAVSVENASLAVGNASALVNQGLAAWKAANLDTQSIEDTLAQAQVALAASPARAQALAQQAMEMAKLQNARLASRTSVYGWIGLAIGAVAVAGVGVWILLRKRSQGRRGL